MPSTLFSSAVVPKRFIRSYRAVVLLALGMAAGGAADSSESGREAAKRSLFASPRLDETGFFATTEFRVVQNTIQLNAKLGSSASAHTFVLDSGAPTTLAPRLARDLALAERATAVLAGPEGGRRAVPVTRIPRVEIAGIGFYDAGAVVDWVAPPKELACLSRDGLIGASLLQAAIWQIDFQTRQITVTDTLEKLPGLSSAMRLPFRRADSAGSPRIDVSLGAVGNASLLVDLGFNGSLAMPIALFRKSGNHLADDAPMERGHSSSTVLGSPASVVRIGRLQTFGIGDWALRDFPVVTGDTISDFHVGIAFLRHFRITLDWRHDALYLERREPLERLYGEFRTYGFKAELRDGALVVGALWRNGAAERTGIALGDRIVAIDAQSTRAPDFDSFCRIADRVGLFGEDDAALAVTVQRGQRVRTVSLTKRPLLLRTAHEPPSITDGREPTDGVGE